MTRTPQFDAVIFDLDGTLLDTEHLSDLSNKAVVAQFGKEFPAELRKRILGRPSAEWTRMVIAELELEGLITPLAMAQQWEEGMHAMFGDLVEMPGALALVQRLKRQGVPMALATSSSSRAVAAKRLHHSELFTHFDVIVTGDDAAVKHGKPAPDIFQVAAQRMVEGGVVKQTEEGDVVPSRFVVVEDSPLGIAAAKAAGMFAVAVPDSRIHDTEAERQTQFHAADAILSGVGELDARFFSSTEQ